MSAHDHDHDHDHAHDHGHAHDHDQGHGHGHAHDVVDLGGGFHSHDGLKPHKHEPLDGPGQFGAPGESFSAAQPGRVYSGDAPRARAFTVGIGGPVGSGKTALCLALCKHLRDDYSLGCVTNDIFTREDAEFLQRHEALAPGRVAAVETGGCPHAAIREDVAENLAALEDLTRKFQCDVCLCEAGGDNLAASFSRELADFTIYVIDVSGGDKIPRKGGPGITQSDLLVINKTDLAEAVGADLEVMRRDGTKQRVGRNGSADGPVSLPLTNRGG